MEAKLAMYPGLIDFQDGTLFGNDAGEDELPEILNSYFVDQEGFKTFLSRAVPFQVARSRKGMGKSALLSKMAYDLDTESSDGIVINVTGAKLLAIADPPANASHLMLQNYWTKVICARINFALGGKIGFAFSDTSMALVEAAELSGYKERNIAGSLIQRIKSSKIPIEIITKEYPNHEELLKRALEGSHNIKVWLFVDDIDSTYVDSEYQQALTSTFFSACRALAREVSGLAIRASVRTDVWSNLRKNEDLDKCEQYVTDIVWSSANIKTILSKKIFSYLQRNDILPRVGIDYRQDADELLECAFEDRMTWGRAKVSPFRPIHILSAGRPRWMSQLCRLSGVEAAKAKKPLIEKSHINSSEKVYSRLRLNDIYKEHNHQYAGLEKLIETFSSSPARYTTNDLLSQIVKMYVNGVGVVNIPELDGVRYSQPLQLAHFLYKIGFIVGRKDHVGSSGNADFARYEERPELLVDGRNADDGMLWEIHPAYRETLNIGKVQKVASGAQQRRNRKHNYNKPAKTPSQIGKSRPPKR